jgi:hypothetical protein
MYEIRRIIILSTLVQEFDSLIHCILAIQHSCRRKIKTEIPSHRKVNYLATLQVEHKIIYVCSVYFTQDLLKRR